MISRNFIKLLLAGFVISIPVSWILMNNWFRNFAYQTNISWWVFALTLAGLLFLLCFSIGIQTFNEARRNPVEVLRHQ